MVITRFCLQHSYLKTGAYTVYFSGKGRGKGEREKEKKKEKKRKMKKVKEGWKKRKKENLFFI